MNTKPQKATSTNNPIAAIVFYIASILLFPISALGYLLWVGKLFLVRNKSGVSLTAQGPLSARWLQHQLGVRPDEPASRLLMAVPGIPRLAVCMVFGPTLLASRLSGYVPGAFRYPFEGKVTISNQGASRQTFYDSVVERYLPKVAQFVILGAGFDTRAFRIPTDVPVRSFEVDTPRTQVVKRQILRQAGVDSSNGGISATGRTAATVTFVPADFVKEDWLAKLVAAGFDLGKPALFIWEGVTPYLDRASIEDTLRKIASTAPESMVAFDYFTTEVLESNAFFMRYARAGTQAAGEPFKFGVDSTPPTRDRLSEFIQPCGLVLLEQRTLGEESDGKRAWGGFAIAIKTH